MIINVTLEKGKIIGYQTYPISMDKEYIEVEKIPEDLLSGVYGVRNHQLTKEDGTYSKESLQKAFEQYKNDVFYGKIKASELHSDILAWYEKLSLDDLDSLNNPPKTILHYLGETL